MLHYARLCVMTCQASRQTSCCFYSPAANQQDRCLAALFQSELWRREGTGRVLRERLGNGAIRASFDTGSAGFFMRSGPVYVIATVL